MFTHRQPNREGAHETYTQHERHWCPRSEAYTGGDSLITAMRNGWMLTGLVYSQEFRLRGGRTTRLYHFVLRRETETLTMPIVSNPFIQRMLSREQLRVIETYDRHTAKRQADSPPYPEHTAFMQHGSASAARDELTETKEQKSVRDARTF